MKKIIFIASAAFLLTGCGSNVDLVKDGVMEFDKSITVGDAIDNYKACKSVKWSEFTSTDKREVVEAKCTLKDEYKSKHNISVKGPIELTIQFNINKDGETFEFRYAGISADGKETPDLGVEALAAIYANDDS